MGGGWVVDEASQTHFVYDQAGHLLGEYDKSGTALREYIWLDDTPVALVMPSIRVGAVPVVYYIHTDHLNTPRAVMNGAGQLRWRWIADPFGTAVPETNPAGLGAFVQNLRFPGQYADSETGLFYNMARYYDPMIGRYVESDPIGLGGGINTYAYVGGNPLSYFDALGLLPMSPEEVAKIIKVNNHSPLSNEMIMCLMWQESGFDPDVENDGARGLMQIRKNQALAQVNKKDGPFAWQDLFNPKTNTEVGTLYLNWVSQRPGDLDRNIQRRYGTGDDYPVVKMRQCEKCLQDNCSKDGDVKKCLTKVHR